MWFSLIRNASNEAGQRFPAPGAQVLFVVHEQWSAVLGHQIRVVAGAGGGAGEELKKIERRSFAGEQAAGRSGEFEQQPLGNHGLSVGHVPGDADAGVELTEHFVHPGAAANDAVFA